MSVAFYFMPIVIGYTLLVLFPFTTRTFLTRTGQQTILSSAAVGLVVWIVVFSIMYYPVLWIFEHDLQFESGWVGLVSFTLVLGFGLLSIWAEKEESKKGPERYIDTLNTDSLDKGDLIGIALNRAWKDNEEVEIRLKNREIIVGRPLRGNLAGCSAISQADVVIYPAVRGYLDDKTLRPVYTQDLTEQYRDRFVDRSNQMSVRAITISRNEIVYVHRFSLSGYEIFKTVVSENGKADNEEGEIKDSAYDYEKQKYPDILPIEPQQQFFPKVFTRR